MATVPTYKAAKKVFDALGCKKHFESLDVLLKELPIEVALAFCFLKIEQAHIRTLYCGTVKKHRAEPGVAYNVIAGQHITREKFNELFKTIFDASVNNTALAHLKKAEKVRDHVIHGKSMQKKQILEAVVEALNYAEQFNNQMKNDFGFEPFGDLRGFKGRGQPLDKTTTRWLLKGLGFTA